MRCRHYILTQGHGVASLQFFWLHCPTQFKSGSKCCKAACDVRSYYGRWFKWLKPIVDYCEGWINNFHAAGAVATILDLYYGQWINTDEWIQPWLHGGKLRFEPCLGIQPAISKTPCSRCLPAARLWIQGKMDGTRMALSVHCKSLVYVALRHSTSDDQWSSFGLQAWKVRLQHTQDGDNCAYWTTGQRVDSCAWCCQNKSVLEVLSHQRWPGPAKHKGYQEVIILAGCIRIFYTDVSSNNYYNRTCMTAYL
jgi:hypothetical protein